MEFRNEMDHGSYARYSYHFSTRVIPGKRKDDVFGYLKDISKLRVICDYIPIFSYVKNFNLF